jgi:hypothetical protein
LFTLVAHEHGGTEDI